MSTRNTSPNIVSTDGIIHLSTFIPNRSNTLNPLIRNSDGEEQIKLKLEHIVTLEINNKFLFDNSEQSANEWFDADLSILLISTDSEWRNQELSRGKDVTSMNYAISPMNYAVSTQDVKVSPEHSINRIWSGRQEIIPVKISPQSKSIVIQFDLIRPNEFKFKNHVMVKSWRKINLVFELRYQQKVVKWSGGPYHLVNKIIKEKKKNRKSGSKQTKKTTNKISSSFSTESDTSSTESEASSTESDSESESSDTESSSNKHSNKRSFKNLSNNEFVKMFKKVKY